MTGTSSTCASTTGALWWEFWHPRHEWTSGTPRWRHGNFNLTDFVLGQRAYSTVEDEPVLVVIPMPEASYPAAVTMETATWKRPRWPWPLIIRCADVELLDTTDGKPGYIPVPGKGENSWDCGPDGIFGSSFPAKSVEEAIGKMVGSALQDRKRNGGSPFYGERIEAS